MEHQQLKDMTKAMQKKIQMDDLRELVAKSRWTCDSNWMMAMVMNAGWDVANKMNLQVAQSVGKVEMHRLMKMLNLDRPKDENEFMKLVSLAMCLDVKESLLKCLKDGASQCEIEVETVAFPPKNVS